VSELVCIVPLAPKKDQTICQVVRKHTSQNELQLRLKIGNNKNGIYNICHHDLELWYSSKNFFLYARGEFQIYFDWST